MSSVDLSKSNKDLITVGKSNKDLTGSLNPSIKDLTAISKSNRDLTAISKCNGDLNFISKSNGDLNGIRKSNGDLNATSKSNGDLNTTKSNKDLTEAPLSPVKTLPLDVLQKIFQKLDSIPQTLSAADGSCRLFHKVLNLPSFKALKYTLKYGPNLVFFELYRKDRDLLTFELTAALLDRGVPLPKYLVQSRLI
jgi:hypothetical protein